jgi:mono/diheme cytochrome c family protein
MAAMRRTHTWTLVAAIVLVAACGPGVSEDATGEAVYLQVCARCHADHLGGGFGPALVGFDAPSLDKPRDFFEQTVRTGIGRMPAFGGTLSEDQIDRVLDYVLTQRGR